MKKINRKRKLKPRLMKTLLRVKKVGTGGKQYRVKPSEVRDDEIKRMIKQVNDSLYRLEKSGVAGQSAIYRTIEKYAISDPNSTGKMYNVNEEKGTVRVSKDLSRYKTQEEKSKFVNILRNILSAKTRTVSGTRSAMKKAYETAKARNDFEGTLEDYQNMWKIFKEQVQPDQRQNVDSNTVIRFMERFDIYSMSREEISEAMNYFNRGTDAGWAAVVERFGSYMKEL